MNSTAGQDPREASFMIINSYISSKTNLKQIINRQLEKYSFSSTDRRFIHELVKGTVRYLIRIDYLISLFSRIKVSRIDLEVLNILRTAVYQFMFMSRVPGYSIVSESVRIVKKHSGIPASKFVNALLRKISSIEDVFQYTEDSIDKNTQGSRQRLVLKYSFPSWLVDYWANTYDSEKTERLLSSLNEPSVNFLRINSIKTDKNNLVRMFGKNGLTADRDFDVLSSDSISKKVFRDTLVFKSLQGLKEAPGYEQGFFSIQDFSSQLAVKHFLKPQEGEKILDLCGAPGGKATYMAELAGDICEIVSLDINKNKIGVFNENIRRLGLKSIKVMKADVTSSDFIKYKNYFDKIFIDCPCSALGTISKNPDVKYNREMDDIKRLAEQSLRIISNCREYLKKTGRIVYYTCTLSKTENQDVIEKFIRKNRNIFDVAACALPAFHSIYLEDRGIVLKPEDVFQEIMPYYFNSEGGFVAVMKSINAD